MLTLHKRSDMGIFRHLSKRAVCSLEFHKQIASKAHLFFQSIKTFMETSEMQKKIEKKFLGF